MSLQRSWPVTVDSVAYTTQLYASELGLSVKQLGTHEIKPEFDTLNFGYFNINHSRDRKREGSRS